MVIMGGAWREVAPPDTPSQVRIMEVYPQNVTDPASTWVRE
jgi:hypothetical protein